MSDMTPQEFEAWKAKKARMRKRKPPDMSEEDWQEYKRSERLRSFISSKGKPRPIDSQLPELKNTCAQQEAWIVGNGPSLCLTPTLPDALAGRLVIGCNYIWENHRRDGGGHVFTRALLPDYLGITDGNIYRKRKDKIDRLPCTKVFFFCRVYSGKAKEIWSMKPWPQNCILVNRTMLEHADAVDKAGVTEFNLSPAFNGWSVVHNLLEFAFFLGCTTCYLLGCDTTASGHHYEPLARRKGNDVKAAERKFRSYEAIRKVFEMHGRMIYNATPGGILEVFPRVDVRTLLDIEVTSWDQLETP